jgi:glyoxylase I family protein
MNIEHFALNVPDPVALADWYVRHLGLRIVRQVDTGTRARFLADAAGRGVLEVYHQAKAPVPDYFAMDPFVLHVAYKADDVARARQALLDAGATAVGEVVVTDAGDEMAFLQDPWGVAIQLVRRVQPLLPAA